jgi:succinoglycan biosynthesis transport protein ExoP
MNASPDAGLHLFDYWRIIRIRLGLVLLIFFLVVATVGVVTFLTPKQYLSFATIEVKPDMTQVRIFDNSTSEQINDPKFIETQFQIITRQGVLYPVIERLDLQKKWARNGVQLPLEAAYDKLHEMMQLHEVRNTNLIQISVNSTDPQEAALLANAIAQEYMNQRVSEQQNLVSKGLEQLRDEVRQKEKAVSDAFAEASRLRTEAGIVDPNPDSIDVTSRVEDSSVMTNQEKVNAAQSKIATLKGRVEELDRLKNEDLMRAAGLLNLNDPVLEQKLPLYQNAVAEKARLLSSGLGHNHPDVGAIQAQIDTIEQQLRQQIASIRKGLVAQLTSAENSLKSMQSNLSASQTEPQEKKTAGAQYLDAKYRYLQARKLLDPAKAKLNSETMERTMPLKPAMIRDPAEAALKPSWPRVFLNLFLGGIAGLVLGIGFAFFLEYLDPSVKTLQEVERFLELPVLSVIPKNMPLLPKGDPDDRDAEPYRILKTNVDFSRQKVAASVLTVVSGSPGEGKSATVCNLASVYAASGQQTLVVDADLRRPSQHELFGIDNRAGLSDYLRGKLAFDQVIQDGPIPNLFVITSGSSPANAVTLLSSQKFAELAETVKDWFDLVIFDCPPILGVSDASVISSLAEASIIVTQHRRFPRSMMVRAKHALQSLGTKILGIVLNNVDVKYDTHYRYYTTYSRYGYEKTKERLPRKAKEPTPVASPNGGKPLPGVTIQERHEEELEVSEFESAANRSFGDDIY